MGRQWPDSHTGCIYMYIWASPDSAFRELGRGMRRFWRSRSLAAVVADDLVDLDDDVFGNIGINRLAIDHLCESDAIVLYGSLLLIELQNVIGINDTICSLSFLLNGYLKRSLRVTTFWNALLYWLFASPYVVTSTG